MAISQASRGMTVTTTPIEDDALLLSSLNAWERVSGLFRFDCTFTSEDPNVAFDSVVGQGIGLELEMASGEIRHFHGMVATFSQSESEGQNVIYRAQLVPRLWFLTRSTDCRIFQKKSVTDIISEVFDDHQFSEYKIDIEKTYPEIPYCVQYRETDFAFVSRLMEEWGISYYHSHSADGHELVLCDSPAKALACPGQAEASYQTDSGEDNTAGQVQEWHAKQEFRPGAYALRDYNFNDPSLDLGVQTTTQEPVGGNDRFEVYDYPGRYKALGEGDDRALVRMEAEECAAHRIEGTGTCYGMCPGYKFDLKGHYRDSFNDSYLITEVQHSFSQAIGSVEENSTYENSFACIPHSVPYRPPRATKRPLIYGTQTAVVVGESGKEIDIDDYGSVIVQFHWDRKGERDANSSRRVRVSQNWAGKEWGAFFAPRIGQEVIVEFMEGDPDRPIIIGRVYNGELKPPYTNGEHSGIKTRSTMEGEPSNFNELRFEDTKGSELVFIQAEKDESIVIKNDMSESVGHDRTRDVENDEVVTVGSNQTLTVGENQTVTVKKTRTDTVEGDEIRDVQGDRTRTVTGLETVTVTKDQSLTVEAARTVGVTDNQETTVGGDCALTVEKGHTVTVTDGYTLNAKTVSITAEDEIIFTTGSAEIKMESSGDISIKGNKITVSGDGDVVIEGSKVAIN